jgi:hypothetical protein
MIWWLVVMPVALLLLAWGGANWKVFHLMYCKHLLAGSPQEQRRGIALVEKHHLSVGMSIDEVRELYAPVDICEVPMHLLAGQKVMVAHPSDDKAYGTLLQFNNSSGKLLLFEASRL